MKTRWKDLPQDVKETISDIREKMVIADDGLRHPTIYRSRTGSMELIREVIRITDGMMLEGK